MRRPSFFPRLLAASFLALLSACATSQHEGTAASDAPRSPAAVASAEPAAPKPSVTPLAKKGARGRVVYDLAAHPEHAEQRVAGQLFVDFGAPGDVKYTLGGWGTRVSTRAVVDGQSVALVEGNYGDVAFTLPKDLATPHLHVHARAPRDGDLTLFIDDKEVKRSKGSKSGFETVSFAVPAALATAGEHLLRLRGTGTATLGKHTTGVALDWLMVSDSATPPAAPAPLTSLALEPGARVAYLVPVTKGSALTLKPQGAAVDVHVVREDGASMRLGSVADGREDTLALGRFAGEVVRIELAAAKPATLARAVIVDNDTPLGEPGAAPPKHVLIYLIDTLRADHLKPFNPSTRVSAPGLDALVELGSAVFTSAHTQENWTKPSVATLLSSLFPWEHHAITTEAVVPNEVQLLPERLGAQGFYTGAFIANGYVSDKFGFKQGWNTYRNYIREGRYSRAEFLAADVVSWLDKRPTEKPFFLYVHAIDPHVPYKPTAKFLNVYDPNPYSGIVDFSKDNELLEKVKMGKIKLNDRDKVHLEALYDSEISYHDVHFHAIMEALEKRNLHEDTLVVIVADHGEEFWDHGLVGHGHSVYEELIRIPMVIRVPGLTKSRTVTSSSNLVDIVPTVFDALGKERPSGLSGRSLMPELRQADVDAPAYSVAGFMDNFRALVVGKTKLIQRSEKRFSVYDLTTDPSEQTDVARDRPLTTRFLRAQLGFALGAVATSGEAKKVVKRQTTNIDAETEAQLRALGYVDGSRR